MLATAASLVLAIVDLGLPDLDQVVHLVAPVSRRSYVYLPSRRR